MKIEKLEKYRKGNFVFTYKHLYAQKKLKHIRKLITSKFNLVGGGREPVVDQLSKIEGFIKEPTVEGIIKNITNNMKDEGLLVESDQQVFKELMDADKALVKEFDFYESLGSENYNGLEKPEKVKEELLNIQKSLFNLQVKIIFSKLKKITKVDITPLLGVINNKINKMNNYIEKQEEIFAVESTSTAPQNKPSLSNTQVKSSEPANKPEVVEPEKPPAQPTSGGKINEKNLSEDNVDDIFSEMQEIQVNGVGLTGALKLGKPDEPLETIRINKLKELLGDKLYNKGIEKLGGALTYGTLGTFKEEINGLL